LGCETSCRPAGRAGIKRIAGPDWPDGLGEIVYVDHFGNAVTGLRAAMLPPGLVAPDSHVGARDELQRSAAGRGLLVREFERARQIAVNQGRADLDLDLAIGIPVEIA
jgi:hypothetical protein